MAKTDAPVQEKKRTSKAVKRKAKKAPEPEDDEDSEVEEKVEVAEKAPEEVPGKLAKKQKTKANRFEEMAAAAEKEPEEPRGVIYVGHIPDGFFEPQMKKFFSQFGRVTRLRISRSKKTAKSKGFAFVEFEEEQVAKIVAETMQGYLLFDKTLVCHMLTKDKCHKLLFKGHKRRMINTSFNRRKRHVALYNDRPTVEVNGEQVPRHTLRQAERRNRSDKKLTSMLADLGVSYDVSGADDVARGSKSPKTSASASPKVAAAAAPPAAATAGAAAPASTKKKKRKLA